MISIGIFCIAIALIALQFKTIKQEYGVFISVAGCVFIFVYSMTKLSDIVDIMDAILSIFFALEDAADIRLSFGARAKRGRVWQHSL